MERRAVVAGIAALLATPLAGEAQRAAKVHHVGVLSPGGPTPFWTVFVEALHERGWTDGGNVAFEYRFAEGHTDRLPALAVDLVKRDVDVIVAGLGATTAAMKATASIPIVMTFGAAEVEAGLVGSLARPQGNVTGLTGDVATDIMGKRLELLREIAPSIRRVVALSGRIPSMGPYVEAFEAAGRRLGLALNRVEIDGSHDVERAFTAIREVRPDALYCGGDPVMRPLRPRILDFASRQRLPSVYGLREWADAGGLLAFGVSLRDVFQRVASYVDRILRGTKPGDLPIERPSKYELVINLKTAKSLRLTIPPSLLVRADQVIE